jgi:hypothetical protein
MNPLESLKEKLKIKPKVEIYKPVEIVLKEKEITKETETKTEEEQEELKPQTIGEKKRKRVQIQAPTIVEEIDVQFDREALLKKLAENKLAKVILKPTVEIALPTVSKPIVEKKKAKPVSKTKVKLIIEPDEDEIEILTQKEQEEAKVGVEDIDVDVDIQEQMKGQPKVVEPKKRGRKKKGEVVLGPESMVVIDEETVLKRLPKKQIVLKEPSYYMNNREKFVNFINSIFEKYKLEMEENAENISCETIGNTRGQISLLTHQKIVKDYLNLYTPYRGLLLFHGLGSGKTCSSIAIAEGMKDAKKIIVMTPASLRMNYIEEIKKCGDLLYKKDQYWEWVSSDVNPGVMPVLSTVLNLPLEYIRDKGGAWFINIKKQSNYGQLSAVDKKSLDDQLNEMIRNKYTFINYNGLRRSHLDELTMNGTKNLFDNAVVIIDEAHNLVSRIVNKIKKEAKKKPKKEKETGKGADETEAPSPTFLSTRLYEYLLSAKNARIVLLSGTPVINYPNEFGILFNILRGYIKTWEIPLDVRTSKKVDKDSLREMLLGEKNIDYLDYSPSSKVLTITRNPFGFKNKIKKERGEEEFKYMGVSNTKREKTDKGGYVEAIDDEYVSDEGFERIVISILNRNDIHILPQGVKVRNMKALPDTIDLFEGMYIDNVNKKLKNVDALKRRIIGLSSYFRSAQEGLLPKFEKKIGVDYHIVRVPMSDFQFKIYESARKEERKVEKESRKPKKGGDDVYKEPVSTYRIFSRLYCNFVMNERPTPSGKEIGNILDDAKYVEDNIDVDDPIEGEIEGDKVLEVLDNKDYVERINDVIKYMTEHSTEYFAPEALETYSPKFLSILENIRDPEHVGLHLVYSQFRTLEGIGLFSLVLNKNGFARFRIKKNSAGSWEMDIPDHDQGKPMYALYTGTEDSEEKEIIRNIFNGDWNYIPTNLADALKRISNNNNYGEIIKVLMITSSGSEGINLRNTRYVHIMEPYWHPVRMEQVIGRARRICSHKSLPKELQTVEVFVYIMVFTEKQLKSGEAKELLRHDLGKTVPAQPVTSDQLLYQISEIKSNFIRQMTDVVKESAFDCYIYNNGNCLNFGDPSVKSYAYVPDYSKQPNDVTSKINKREIEWVGKIITIEGMEYIYRRMSPTLLYLYDKKSYEIAFDNPGAGLKPSQIGTLEIDDQGRQVVKWIVT